MSLNFQTNRGWTSATLAPQTPAPSTVTPGAPIDGSPAFLQDAITKLLQATGGSNSSSLLRQIMGSAGEGNEYLFAPALAAMAGGQSGLQSLSLAPIQNPLIGSGYNTLAKAQAARSTAQTNAINQVSSIQDQIARLQNQAAPSSIFAAIGRADPNQEKIRLLKQQLKSAQGLGIASASSGWAPMSIPGY